MPKCYDPALVAFSHEVDAIRRHLQRADAEFLTQDSSRRERAAQTKAFSYVWLSAAFETFVKSTLQALLRELSSYSISQCDLAPSLLTLANFSSFDSLRATGGLGMWQRRAEVLVKSISKDTAIFSDVELPLDGRTPRPEHFLTIWKVFQLPGNPIPDPRYVLALNDLANGRNDVAHGNVPPMTFGRQKATADIFRIVDYVENFVIHFASTIDDYLLGKCYLR